ncbi:glycosyltransferase [Methanococcus maripaludis]|jgi:glycosyltransferase involved in cell wall biosynthesis|uniref:Glycosyltransferase n=2 Tax=Methanococcus maripaludis TaxID=39152 RepID=A0A8T3W7N7_METMI|nr:glycosyltransferase [Methanococcus maripaludis]AEK19267.1 group 1 glycosyl transferase [Methanococcus maripaludis X1]MBG0769572.1 glycosyltransferase [Methanococcus maripaludis]
MKILFISGREPSYTRNSVIIKGLKNNSIDILECTSNKKTYFKRYIEVISKFLLKKDYDIVFVGFLGQPLVPIIKKLTKKPIILDAFISIYDTLCFDRKTYTPNSIFGRVAYKLDENSCNLSDLVLLDSKAHVDYFNNTFNIKTDFKRLFVGADTEVFFPQNQTICSNDFNIFYYGTYLPLQGIEIIIKSAKLLEKYPEIKFKIVGRGPESTKIEDLAKQLHIKNIEFINWIPYEKLPIEISNSDICLGGHFGSIDKGKRVISGKTFQFLAMKKPVIVGNNPANKELLEHEKSAMFVEHDSPEDLAEKILELKNDIELRKKIAENGHKTFKKKCTPEKIGLELKEIIEKMI